ncbi:MAG: hypothetical protein JWM10_5314 [Myxococcaceae bacterium]|nr:hypothetical protein [Myxococcaceae bacterium]
MPRRIYVATAGWAIPRDHAPSFPTEGSVLERYAAGLGAVEINSTFYRRHKPETFARWSATVPPGFRFAVKMPRAITHDARLAGTRAALEDFFDDVRPLGRKLGPVLVQLPPSFAYEGRRAGAFFRALRSLYAGLVACEPRHESWFGRGAERLLVEHGVARVLADPAQPAGAAVAGGAGSLVYLRLHGSPQRYYSEYGAERVAALAATARAAARGGVVWCVFDNTALGAATGDALAMVRALQG